MVLCIHSVTAFDPKQTFHKWNNICLTEYNFENHRIQMNNKSAEQTIDHLKNSNELERLLLNNTDEALYFYSMDGKLIYVNAAFEKITGYTTQELYEKNFIPFVHPDDQEWMMKLWEGLYKGDFIEDVEYRIIKKDGEVRWCLSTWKIVLDSDGEEIGIQGKQQDITKRKQNEEEREGLRKSIEATENELKVLKGIIPICSYCHSIRDEDGAWDRFEYYISKHSDAAFSHGICPKCLPKALDEVNEKIIKDKH